MQYFAAIGCFHTLTEAVLFGAVPLFGLECSFAHAVTSLSRNLPLVVVATAIICVSDWGVNGFGGMSRINEERLIRHGLRGLEFNFTQI